MNKNIKIRCPFTGKKYNILTKKGQNILKNYKKYKQQGGSYYNIPNRRPTRRPIRKYERRIDSLLKYEDTDTSAIKENKIFSSKTLETIAILNAQETILNMIQFKGDTYPLLNFLIVLNITKSQSLKTKTIECIRKPTKHNLQNLNIEFENDKINIIESLKLDGLNEYSMYRLFTFDHYLLSIIVDLGLDEGTLWGKDAKKILQKNVLFDMRLFKLEIFLMNKIKMEKKEALDNIREILKNNSKIPLRLSKSYKETIVELNKYYNKYATNLYDSNIRIFCDIKKMMSIYTFLISSFKKQNIDKQIHSDTIQSIKQFIYQLYTKTLNRKQNKKGGAQQRGFNVQVPSSRTVPTASTIVPTASTIVPTASTVSDDLQFKKMLVELFFTVIHTLDGGKMQVIESLKNIKHPNTYMYELEYNIYKLLLIEDNYIRLGTTNPDTLFHDKCIVELINIVDINSLLPINITTEEELLQHRLSIEFDTSKHTDYLNNIHQPQPEESKKLDILSKYVMKNMNTQTSYKTHYIPFYNKQTLSGGATIVQQEPIKLELINEFLNSCEQEVHQKQSVIHIAKTQVEQKGDEVLAGSGEVVTKEENAKEGDLTETWEQEIEDMKEKEGKARELVKTWEQEIEDMNEEEANQEKKK